jgi:predicted DNA binding CopG/RHH family protein
MSPETTTELTRLNIRLPRSLHLQFKSMVVAEGKSIQEVLSEFIENYVEQRRQPRRGGIRK